MTSYLLEVRAQGGQKKLKQGTGWLLRPDIVVTAFHVVGARTPGDWFHRGPEADVTYHLRIGSDEVTLDPAVFDVQADVALLRLVQPAETSVVMPLAEMEPARHAFWHGAGYPGFHNGKLFTVSGQVVNQGHDAHGALQLTIAQGAQVKWDGISGSPVCVGDRVIGVLTDVTDGAATAWAASATAIRRLVGQLDGAPAPPNGPDHAPLSPPGAFEPLDFSGPPILADVLALKPVMPATAVRLARNPIGDRAIRVAEEQHFVLLVGDSGSGKSTLATGVAGHFTSGGRHAYRYHPPSGRDSREITEELRHAITSLDTAVILLDDINTWASSADIERLATAAVSSRVLLVATATPRANQDMQRAELRLRENRVDVTWEKLRPSVAQFLEEHEAQVIGWLRQHRPSEYAHPVGYDVLEQNLASLIESYANKAQTVWQFLFLLRGGWNAIREELQRLVDNGRADLPVLHAAIEQIADVERPVTPEEVVTAIQPICVGGLPPPDTKWVASVFDGMVQQRLMVRARSAYTTVHRDWARSLISASLEHPTSRTAALELLERDFRVDTPRPRRLMVLWSWFYYDTNGAGRFVHEWQQRNRRSNWSVLIGNAAAASLADVALVADRLHILYRDFEWREDLGSAFAAHESLLAGLVEKAGPKDWHLLHKLFTALNYSDPEFAARIISCWPPEQAAATLEATDPIYHDDVDWLLSGLEEHSPDWVRRLGEHLSWDELSERLDQVRTGAATTVLKVVSLLQRMKMPLLRSRLGKIADVLARVLSEASLRELYFEDVVSPIHLEFFPEEMRRIANALNAHALAGQLSRASPTYWDRLLMLTIYARRARSSFGEQFVAALDPVAFVANVRQYRDASANRWRLLLWQLSFGAPEQRSAIATQLYDDVRFVATNNEHERPMLLRALTAVDERLGERLANDLNIPLPEKDDSDIYLAEPFPAALPEGPAMVARLAALDASGEDYDVDAEIFGKKEQDTEPTG
ncbi:hypothetical protein F0U59_18390 [Archangium gephyra]|nr:hypothetical protein F0U59_18390 [Archangium gephyra]